METAFNTNFFNGVKNLKNGLDTYISTAVDTGYLTSYEYGKKMYEIELENLLGVSDLDAELYMNKIDDELEKTESEYIKEMQSIATKYFLGTTADVNEFVSGQIIYDGNTAAPAPATYRTFCGMR